MKNIMKKRPPTIGYGSNIKLHAPRKESVTIKEIMTFLKLQGVYCWRNNAIGTPIKGGGFRPMKKKGISDILGILEGGKFLAIEVKTPQYFRTTPEQREFLLEINRRGGIGFVALCVEDVRKQLSEYIKDYVWNG